MPIPLSCACGKSFAVRDDAAGRKVKCPACQSPVDVPAAPEPTLDLMPATEAKPAGRPCPQCGAGNPPESELCVQCGCVFESAPAAPPARPRSGDRIYNTEKEFEKPPVFPLMVLGMLYRPQYILEYFRGWAQRPAILIQVLALYVLSLAAVSAVAAAGYIGPSRPAAPPVEEENPAAPVPVEEQTLIWKVLPPNMGIDARLCPKYPHAGEEARIRIGVNKEGKLHPTRFSGTIAHGPMPKWDFETGEMTPAKPQGPPKPLSFVKDAKTGWDTYVFTPSEPGQYTVVFNVDPPTDGQPYAASFVVMPAPEKRAAPEAVAPKVITTAMLIVFTLLVSIFSIAFNALTINLASRLFGEGGEFLFLMVVLAFVQAIVNLGQLTLLAFGPFIGPDLMIFARYAFGLWEMVLLVLAIMKVYEFDAFPAIATAVVASLVKMWVVTLIVGKLLGF